MNGEGGIRIYRKYIQKQRVKNISKNTFPVEFDVASFVCSGFCGHFWEQSGNWGGLFYGALFLLFILNIMSITIIILHTMFTKLYKKLNC